MDYSRRTAGTWQQRQHLGKAVMHEQDCGQREQAGSSRKQQKAGVEL